MSREKPGLVDVTDQLDGIRYLIEAVFMAATDLDDRDATSAIQAVCDVANDKIVALSAMVEMMRGDQS